jgi:acyl carrier protein
MLEAQSTKGKITLFVYERFPLAQKRKLGEDVSLLEAGIVDSIGILEIVTFIEEKFLVQVTDEDLIPENFGSIAAIASFIESKMAGRPLLEKPEGTVCEPR